MAQYIFVKFRDQAPSGEVLERISAICEMLTPPSIRDECSNTVAEWPGVSSAYYGIQNSSSVNGPEAGALVIGWLNDQLGEHGSRPPNVEADGSYAVIKALPGGVSFFTDQFGSRTLWYYLGDESLVVSTSQRAIVRFKRDFVPNRSATAWFLSSGCQGPFMSWDGEIGQARPELEYLLDEKAWRLESRSKTGMELPLSGSKSFPAYVDHFQERVTDTLIQIVGSRPKGETLLPISGGLDSRTLLALSVRAGVAGDVQLVNWGVKRQGHVFDDKAAAHQVADSYGKSLLDCCLPREVEDHDRALDLFVEASEGRIDHFNAYTDGFAMWADFVRDGRSLVVRGDIPFTEGLDLDESSARAHIGLEAFSDFSNRHLIPCQSYAEAQEEFNIGRKAGESLLRWRDRLYVQWRVPMVISAFSSVIGGFVENRSPMMSWHLFRNYMALPDDMKGDKKHIEAVWRRTDNSGVASHATGSLLPPAAFFGNAAGRKFILEYLSGLRGAGSFPQELLTAVITALESRPVDVGRLRSLARLGSMRAWLSDRLPARLKARIKAMRPRNLASDVLAYRIVMADKIVKMYEADAMAGHGCVESRAGREKSASGAQPG
jgi:hypothetical protein